MYVEGGAQPINAYTVGNVNKDDIASAIDVIADRKSFGAME